MFLRLLGLTALALFLSSCGAKREPELIFVGIDGADWELIDALIERGELPNFARLKAEGAWGHLINTGPLSSPVAWTTFSTGHFARQHGILDFTYPYTPGTDKRPVNALDKRKPDFWEIASREDRHISVVGYFVSHPAEPINGVMISDRATQYLPGSVTPPHAVRTAEIDWAEKGAGRRAALRRFFPWYRERKDTENAALRAAATYLDGTNVLRLIRREAFVHAQTLKRLAAGTDILVTYYRLPDVIAHSLWKFHDDSDFVEPADPQLVPFLGSALRDTYRNMDAMLGELLARTGPATNLFIVSDHGMGSATGPYATRRVRNFPITGNHRTDGIVLAHGPRIRPGPIVEMNNLDVMPTLMALARLPVSDALPGDVRSDVLDSDFLARDPIRTVPDYAVAVRPATEQAVLDLAAEQETMATLQGLGYIGSELRTSSTIDAEERPIWQAEPRLFAGALTGELIFYLLRQDADAVQRIYDEVLANAPERLDFLNRQLTLRTRALLGDAPLTDGTRQHLQEALERLPATD